MQLLVEHIGQLRAGTNHLIAAGQTRTAAILDLFAAEEAAKVLILLDLVRMRWRDQNNVNRQISYFSSHVARGIYSRLVEYNLGHFGEARDHVERLREDRYLDGPTDVDWIFRNEIETDREELLYVDYVAYEEDARWVSPASHDDYRGQRLDQGVQLVQAMDRLGILSTAALDCLASFAWAEIDREYYSYAEQRQETLGFLKTLDAAGLVSPNPASEDVELVLERWQFPLHSLDLKQRKVPDEELESQRQRAEQALRREWMGDWE